MQEEAERFRSKGGVGGDGGDGGGDADGGRGEVPHRVAARRDNGRGGSGRQQGSRPPSRPILSFRECLQESQLLTISYLWEICVDLLLAKHNNVSVSPGFESPGLRIN